MQAEGSCTVGHCPLFAPLLVLQGAALGRGFDICDWWNWKGNRITAGACGAGSVLAEYSPGTELEEG